MITEKLKALMPKSVLSISSIELFVEGEALEALEPTAEVGVIRLRGRKVFDGTNPMRNGMKPTIVSDEVFFRKEVLESLQEGLVQTDNGWIYEGSLKLDVSAPRSNAVSGKVTPSRAYLTNKSFYMLAREGANNALKARQDGPLEQMAKQLEERAAFLKAQAEAGNPEVAADEQPAGEVRKLEDDYKPALEDE